MILVIGAVMISAMLLVGGKGLFAKDNGIALPSDKVTNSNAIENSLAIKHKEKEVVTQQPVKGNTSKLELENIFDLPFPRKARRIQQALIRQKQKIEEEFSKVVFEKREQAIEELILQAGEEILTAKQEQHQVNEKILQNERKIVDVERKIVDEKKQSVVNLKMLNDIEVGKAQIKIGVKELEYIQKTNLFKLQTVMHDLKLMQDQISHSEREFDIKQADGMLRIKEENLKLYEKYLDNYFSNSMQKLKLMEDENSVSFREKKVRLENLYHRTINVMARWKGIPYIENERSIFSRQERIFEQFMKHHFEWVRM